MGVDVDRVVSLVYVIGSALAGVAGVLVGLLYTQVDFAFGFFIGIKAFTAAVIGGIGYIRGALLGGLVLGWSRASRPGSSPRPTRTSSPSCSWPGCCSCGRPGCSGRPLRLREAVALAGGRRAGWTAALARPRGPPAGGCRLVGLVGRPGLARSGRGWPRSRSGRAAVPPPGRRGHRRSPSRSPRASTWSPAGPGSCPWATSASTPSAPTSTPSWPRPTSGSTCRFAAARPPPGCAPRSWASGGAVSLRLRGDYLAMVTLAFAEIVRNLADQPRPALQPDRRRQRHPGLDIPSHRRLRDPRAGAFYYLIWGLRPPDPGGALAPPALADRPGLAGDPRGRGGRRQHGRPGLRLQAAGLRRLGRPGGDGRAAFSPAWQGLGVPGELHHPADRDPVRHAGGSRRARACRASVLGAAVLTILPEWLRDYGVYRMLLFGGPPGAGRCGTARRASSPPCPRRSPRRRARGGPAARARPAEARLMALLEVRGLTKRFGGLTAVAGVDLSVEAGEIVVRHRAERGGQDDAVRALSGNLRPDAGNVRFRDAIWSACRRTRSPGSASSAPSRRAACSRT